jgi:nitroreductase
MSTEKYKRQNYCKESSLEISRELANLFARRRTIRDFSTEAPPREVVENAIDVARLAPSGANKQPWSFVLVENEECKKEIRTLAEKEEYRFYHEKPNESWHRDLAKLGTDENKQFITDCPYLIVIFHKFYEQDLGEEKQQNYYVKESAGIATGMLIAALHMSGLSVLTYTPTRMRFLTDVLKKPKHEIPFMVLAVGLPAEGAEVPQLTKKSLDEVLEIYK